MSSSSLWQEEDWGVVAQSACWSMFAVLFAIVGLRIFTRAYYGRHRESGGLGVDDYITVFCLAIFLLTCVLLSVGVSYGLGRRMADIDPPSNIVQALKWNVIISSVLIWTFSMPKFAFIATLKRILDYGTKTAVLFWGLAISSQACILATSVWWYVQCTPVERGWDQTVPGKCADVSVLANLGYFTSAYSAFLDMFFALYPIPFIMRLNMPLKARVAVSTALGLSVLACVVTLYKLAIFGDVFIVLAEDPTYPVAYLDILGMSEGAILIICASLPTLGPLYRTARGKVTDRYGSYGSRDPHGSDPGGIVPGGNQGAGPRILLSGGNSKAHSNKDWETFKGLKLDDPERGRAAKTENGGGGAFTRSNSIDVSTDSIPLVSPGRGGAAVGKHGSIRMSIRKPNEHKTTVTGGGVGEEENGICVHKTVDVSVSSESLAGRREHPGAAF